MTTAFQFIFDNAESISIDRRAVTAQTISRDQTVRTISRGGQIWRFTVKLPSGLRWSDIRGHIEDIEHADRYTTGQVQINNAGYNDWLTTYQGDSTNITNWSATYSQGSNAIVVNAPDLVTTGQVVLKKGDLIQLNAPTGHVYSVIQDYVVGDGQCYVHRPVLDIPGEVTTAIAQNVTWNVVCTQMPSWSIFARNQVSWSGEFEFYEVVA
jgi:hypothetical protein